MLEYESIASICDASSRSCFVTKIILSFNLPPVVLSQLVIPSFSRWSSDYTLTITVVNLLLIMCLGGECASVAKYCSRSKIIFQYLLLIFPELLLIHMAAWTLNPCLDWCLISVIKLHCSYSLDSSVFGQLCTGIGMGDMVKILITLLLKKHYFWTMNSM